MSVKHDPLVKAVLDRFPGSEIRDVRLAAIDAAGATLPAEHNGQIYCAPPAVCKTLGAEVDRIRATQEALVVGGDRLTESTAELMRAAHFEWASRFIAKCVADKEIMARLKGETK